MRSRVLKSIAAHLAFALILTAPGLVPYQALAAASASSGRMGVPDEVGRVPSSRMGVPDEISLVPSGRMGVPDEVSLVPSGRQPVVPDVPQIQPLQAAPGAPGAVIPSAPAPEGPAVSKPAPPEAQGFAEPQPLRFVRYAGRFTGISKIWNFFRYGMLIQELAHLVSDAETLPAARAQAARRLGELQRLEPLEVLGVAANRDADPAVREAAKTAVLRVGEKWTPTLIKELKLHPFTSRRSAAAIGLGHIGRYNPDVRIVEALADSVALDLNRDVQLFSVDALKRIGGAKPLNSLVDLLKNPNSPNLRFALQSAVAEASSAQGQAVAPQVVVDELKQAKKALENAALKRAVLISIVPAIGELIGGIMTGSSAVVTDAIHIMADFAINSSGLLANLIARRPPNSRMSYGYLKTESLTSLVSSAAILGLGAVAFYEAAVRFRHPAPIMGGTAAILACLGLASNGISAALLYHHRKGNLNLKTVFRHFGLDAFASLLIIVSGFVIRGTGWVILDPLVSFFIVFLIFHTSWPVVRDSLHILRDGVPRDIDLDALEADLAAVPGVDSLGKLRVRSLTTDERELTARLYVKPGQDTQAVLKAAREKVQKYGISDPTIEIEVLP